MLVQQFDRTTILKTQRLVLGDVIESCAGPGTRLEFDITHADEASVTVDANHPLAGYKLIFDVEIIDFNSRDPGVLGAASSVNRGA